MDIKNEFRYLSALNNNLKNLNKEKIFNIASNSIINEKIKKIELLKYYKEIKINFEYSNMLLKRIYRRRGLESLEEFEAYLEEYGLTIDDIRKKITIDALWNQLVIKKYGAQIEINESKIYKNITQRNNNQTEEYQLAEIIFEIKNKEEINKKYKDIINNIKEVGFENTASMYSFAESSKIGGDIGWVGEASLNNKINAR